VTARSYMSIGDVLTLLRQEFPDVTISKIRFLESQGLVNPERTPSGYRKFYEQDVERLRWVLRQQREHFLPLKVIKDRLDDPTGSHVGTSARRASPASSAGDPSPDGQDHQGAVDEPARPVLVGQRATAEPRGRSERGGERATVDSGGHREHREQREHNELGRTRSPLPGIGATGAAMQPDRTSPVQSAGAPPRKTIAERGSPSPGPVAGDDVGPRAQPTEPGAGATGLAGPPAAAPAAGPPATAPAAGPPAAAPAAARRSPSSGSGDAEPVAPRRAKHDAATPEGPTGADPAANGATEPARPSPKPAASAARGKRSGTNLSVEELSSACGLEVGVLRELEEFGLLASTNVAGVESFGEDALAIAQLAGQFARFGVEPRHLRLYKNAADREAGFVEQIVLPLVRQRNPEARVRAHETADELALLGQQLRTSLLRCALGALLHE
jgi:DNA-binding transcriptional MerR regulator